MKINATLCAVYVSVRNSKNLSLENRKLTYKLKLHNILKTMDKIKA